MLRCVRLVLAFLLTATGLGAFGQELVIFTDHRALQVQSHRVEGNWTYLRIGSGEMAVPSASVLRVDNERTTTAAAVLPAHAPASPAAAATSQPSPAASAPDMVRRPTPPPVPPANVDPDEETDSEVDEEVDEPAPEPAKPPDVQKPAPGQPMNAPGMPPRPGVFQPPQPPGGIQPQKPVEDD